MGIADWNVLGNLAWDFGFEKGDARGIVGPRWVLIQGTYS